MSSFVVGVVVTAVFVGGGGAAWAANGKPMVLGLSNKATKTTKVTNSKGTPLTLTAGQGKAPLAVNSGTKVANLNADKLDGLSSEAFVRSSMQSTMARAQGVWEDVDSNSTPDVLVAVATCPTGSFMTGTSARSGFFQTTKKQVPSDLLERVAAVIAKRK